MDADSDERTAWQSKVGRDRQGSALVAAGRAVFFFKTLFTEDREASLNFFRQRQKQYG
jgi:hypothetical protein